jgi:hypothetical protein
MKFAYSFAVLVLFVLVAWLFGSSCANIVPPNGGPRDSIPPRLISATPRDSTVNFRGTRIQLNFDEYIDLQEVQNNLLFTPLFDKRPRVEVVRKEITITFQDTLEPNTTYIFNFGNAVRDINEGNVLKNFTYTFSTGPVLDSLELTGRVLMAQTGKVDSTLTVVLHRNLTDSAVYNQTPRYAVRLDPQGNFRFQNLAPGRYAVYAIGDAGIARRYNNPRKQAFAFLDSAVVVQAVRDSIKPLTLYAFVDAPAAAPTTTTVTTGNRAPAAATNRLTLTTNLANNQQDLLNPLVITFATPLRTFDSTALRLSTDTVFRPSTYTYILDSTRKQLTIRSQWQENARYNLVLEKTFATDTAGRQLLKSDTLFFNTRKLADYGNLVIRLKNPEPARNPVLLLVQNEQVIQSASIKNGVFRRELMNPGEYEVRILYDTNNNGKWDPGQFLGGPRRQPELVRPMERKVTVKANWDNEFDL